MGQDGSKSLISSRTLKEAAVMRLLVRPRPEPHEGLFNFLRRVCEANSYESHRWLFNLRSSPPPATLTLGSAVNFLASKVWIAGLGKLLDVPGKKLFRMTHHGFADTLMGESKEVGPWGCDMLPLSAPRQRFFLISTVKVCPSCLRENPQHHRQTWDLIAVTVCLNHRSYLLDRCPKCLRTIPLERKKRLFCPCGTSYARASYGHVPNATWANQLTLQQALENERGAGLIDRGGELVRIVAHTVPLLLSSGVIMKCLEKTKALPPGIHGGKPSGEVVSGLVDTVVKWVGASSEPFCEFLDQLIQLHREGTPGGTGIGRDFGRLGMAFARIPDDSPARILRRRYEDYLLSRWDGGHVSTKQRVFKEAPHRINEARFLSVAKTARALGVSVEDVPMLVDTELLSGHVRQAGSRKVYLIDRKSLQELREKRENLLNRRTVASLLGVGERVVSRLARAGLLPTRGGKLVDGRSKYLFAASDVDAFLERLTSGRSRPGMGEDCLDIEAARKALSPLGITTPAILEMTLEGRLQPLYDPDKKGLNGLLIPHSQIADLLADARLDRRLGIGLTLNDAAKELGVREPVLKRWLDRGLVRSTEFQAVGRPSRQLIPLSELESFRREYLTAGDVARELGVTKRTVGVWIENGRLCAASGRNIDGGLRYLIKNTELKRFMEGMSRQNDPIG